MAVAKLSSKNQIVIPKEIRQALKLKQGSKVYIYSSVRDKKIVVDKAVEDPLEEMIGLGADIWKSLGGGDKYIREERASWGDR